MNNARHLHLPRPLRYSWTKWARLYFYLFRISGGSWENMWYAFTRDGDEFLIVIRGKHWNSSGLIRSRRGREGLADSIYYKHLNLRNSFPSQRPDTTYEIFGQLHPESENQYKTIRAKKCTVQMEAIRGNWTWLMGKWRDPAQKKPRDVIIMGSDSHTADYFFSGSIADRKIVPPPQ